MDPKISNDPKLLQKGTKNGTTFGTLWRRISEVQKMRFWELNESGEIAIAIGIVLEGPLKAMSERACSAFNRPPRLPWLLKAFSNVLKVLKKLVVALNMF